MVAFSEAEGSSAPSREQQLTTIATLMSEGKRSFFANEYLVAAEKLSQAASLSVEVYGDMNVETFEPHLWYGRAMLELGRMEEDVLDNAVKGLPVPNEDDSIDEERFGNPDKLSETEKEEIKNQVDEALSEEAGVHDKEEPSQAQSETEECKDDQSSDLPSAEEAEAAVAAIAEEGSEISEAEEVQQEAEDGVEEEEEETTDIQIAWEVLETARTICEKQVQDKEWELKKADVLFFLSDVSLVNDDFVKAIEDINTVIELQKKHLKANDRILAQTYVQMARAYKAMDDYENAGKYYKLSKEAIIEKLAELKATVENDEEKKKTILEEIEDLEAIVADLELKLEDSEESLKQLENKMDQVREQMGMPAQKVLSETSSAPATDITNMVRKTVKRPADEGAINDTKKARGDEAILETETPSTA